LESDGRFTQVIERLRASEDAASLYGEMAGSLPKGAELMELVEALSAVHSEISANFLAEIHKGTQDKKTRKSVKKALYILRTRGVKTPEVGEAAPRIYSPPQPPKSEAHASNVDGYGERLVFAFVPAGMGRNIGFQFLLSDKRGMAEMFAEELSRKKYIDRIADISNEGYLTIAATTLGHAAWLAERAAGITPDTSEQLRQYGMVKAYLEGQPHPPTPMIYEKLGAVPPVPPDRGNDGYLKLLELKEFGSWHADAAEADRWALDVAEASASKLVLNEEQRKGRIDAVMKEAVSTFLTPESIAILKSRLEENAFILFETSRREEAELAAELALEIEKGRDGMNAGALSFAQTLVARSVLARMKKPVQSGKDNLVVPA
jgi:hypothetical protein